MKLIDVDAKITAILYDEEHEETNHKIMTVEDFLDGYTEEGCPRPINDWISVKDRLPEENKEYIVFVVADEEQYVTSDHWEARKWFLFDTQDAVVTHWMPLPSTEGIE